jgi:hypothetical protein
MSNCPVAIAKEGTAICQPENITYKSLLKKY